MTSNLSYFNSMAKDWMVTSYGDLGAFAGYGGKVAHMRFYSPSLNVKMHTLCIQAGFGLGAEITPSFLEKANTWFDNFTKARDAASAESGYKALICHRSFSLNDIDGGNVGAIDTAVAIPYGYKSGFFHASGSRRGPAKGTFLFTIPAEVEPTFGFKAEASATGGFFLGLDNYEHERIKLDRWKREKNRRPTDPLIRPPGGF